MRRLTQTPQARMRRVVALLAVACLLSTSLLAALAFSTQADWPIAQAAAVAGFPDWSKAGYKDGTSLPTGATTVNVSLTNGADVTTALQAAIDANKTTDLSNTTNPIKVLQLNAGTFYLSRQIWLDGNNLILRGAGTGTTGTRFIFQPDTNTRYDVLTSDGSQPDMSAMYHGATNQSMNWVWPGRGAFRVQSREVHTYYATDYASAPANRKDIFEGSVNFQWRNGIKVRQSSSYAALKGENKVYLDAAPAGISVGGLVYVGAANSINMYQQQGVSSSYYENGHMKTQMFKVTAVSTSSPYSVTLDKSLEYDIPANNASDGSAKIDGADYFSRLMPVRAIQNVGLENFYLEQQLSGMPKLGGGTYSTSVADASHNYGNIAPEYAIHGIVLKFVNDSWVKGVKTYMTGSHPIVTEFVRNSTFENNNLDGSWNKGKGGNGYFRGSKAYSSLFKGNITRNLRHFTFQWSATGNVAKNNDFDSDINLHGGWERHNLIESNTVNVPYEHYSGNCRLPAVCGTGGESGSDDSTWYPIWWGSGPHAGKWSGATGPQNVFLNNTLAKQETVGGPYVTYSLYTEASRVYQFGTDRATAQGSAWEPLKVSGTMISTWGGNEKVDFSTGSNVGVNDNCTYTGSLHTANGTLTCSGAPPPTPTPTPTPTTPPAGGGNVEVKARIEQDTASRTKYDVEVKNTGSSALSGFAARVYVDLTEVFSSGRTVSSVKCDERYDQAGSATCTLVQYSGNIYYAKLDFGSYSLAANATVSYKITLRLSDWSDNWSSSNDYSRVGLSSTLATTARIPVYQGSSLIYGTNP